MNWTLGENFENLTLKGAAAKATGNADDNIITGNAKDNVMTGLAGDDTLKGAGGADTFVFAPGSGHDTISDFDHGQDRIDLSSYAGLNGIADMFSIEDYGKGVLVALVENGDTIFVSGLKVADIGETDFIFAA